MATRNYSVIGDNNFIGVNCDGVVLHNCNNVTVQPFTTNVTAIGCSNVEFSPKDSNSIWINNGRASYVRSRAATSSAPILIGRNFNLFFLDTSTGDATILLDAIAMVDFPVTFKVTDNSNDLIFQTLTNTELIDGNALPYTLTPSTNRSLTVISDGTDFQIIWDYNTATGGGGTPAGSNTQVQFNDSGSFGGDAGMTYNKTTDELIVSGNIDTPLVETTDVKAKTSAGLLIESNGGNDCALFGAGGGQNVTFYDGVKLDAKTASAVVITDTNKNLDTLVLGAGQSIRRNAGDTAYEAYTPSSGGLTQQQVEGLI